MKVNLKRHVDSSLEREGIPKYSIWQPYNLIQVDREGTILNEEIGISFGDLACKLQKRLCKSLNKSK